MSLHLLPASLPFGAALGLLRSVPILSPPAPTCCQDSVPRRKALPFQRQGDLPVSTHPISIFPGKINSSNMSALNWRCEELFLALGTQGCSPPAH